MALSKEEADALRQCNHILHASRDSSSRQSIAYRTEDFIKKGRWPLYLLSEIARLFYPSDLSREKDMLSQLLKEFGSRPGLPLSASDLAAWADCPPVPKDSPLRYWLPAFMHEVEPTQAQSSPPALVKVNKLRRNSLDPAIDKAVELAGNKRLADVYLQLRELAIEEEKPFTGIIDGDALCYTNDNGEAAKLTKDALGKRLKNRENKPLTAA